MPGRSASGSNETWKSSAAAAAPVAVHPERGELGRGPAAVVVDHGQRGSVVPARDPLGRGWHPEQVRAITDQGYHDPFGRRSELSPDGAAAGPAQGTAAGPQVGPGRGGPQVLGHDLVVGDRLGEHERIGAGQQLADARGQVPGRDHAGLGLLERVERGAAGPVGGGDLRPAGLHHVGFGQVFIPNEPGDLLQGHLRVGGGEAARGDLPHGHRGFQRVDVDDVDRGVRARAGWWPGSTARGCRRPG